MLTTGASHECGIAIKKFRVRFAPWNPWPDRLRTSGIFTLAVAKVATTYPRTLSCEERRR